MTDVTFRPYDMAEYLRDDDDIAAYLQVAAEEHDPDVLAAALGAVARARGMAQVAQETGITGEVLSEALGPNGNPTLATVMRVADALGFDLSFKARSFKARSFKARSFKARTAV